MTRFKLLVLTLLLVGTHAQGQSLKVTLLGTGKPLPEIDRFGPATLVEAGGLRLLFDAGRGASQRLWQQKIPLGGVDMIFLTHLHSDHVVGLPDLWLTGLLPGPYARRTGPLQVAGPPGTAEMMGHLEKAFAWDLRVRHEGEGSPEKDTVRAADVTEGIVFERNGVKVTAFAVDHGEHLKPALGYRVDYENHSVLISGDTHYSENLIRHAAGVDVIIHEVIAAKEELLTRSPVARQVVSYHTPPEDAGKVFVAVKPRLAVYTHIVFLQMDPKIGIPTLEELVERTRRTYQGPLEIGEDRMIIEIGDQVAVKRP